MSQYMLTELTDPIISTLTLELTYQHKYQELLHENTNKCASMWNNHLPSSICSGNGMEGNHRGIGGNIL